nr:DUF115 domain-containing protein [Desulfobulbaceae bacterium]
MINTKNEIYEKNMSVLAIHHPRKWEALQENGSEPLGKIVTAPNGQLNLQLQSTSGQDILLHKKDDPLQEIQTFLNMVPVNSSGSVVLLGLGLGYTLKALVEKRHSIRHFILFEAELGVFHQALINTDLRQVLSDRRVILSIGNNPNAPEVLAPASKALQLESIHTLKHMPSFTYAPDTYKEIADSVFSQVSSYNVEGSTSMTFGHTFIDNRLRHFSTMPHNNRIEDIQGHFAGTPAIIVAGGPSLDKNVHLLSKVKGNAVIIAVDSVLPSLLAHNVTPDFLTSIDPQDNTYEKIADLTDKAKDLSLICMSWVTPKVPKIFPAEHVFWTFSAKPIEKWLNNLIGGSLLTGGAGTVAHLNILSAIIMGCSPIVFIGQDLAYTDDKDHTSHAVLQHKDLMKNTLKSSTEAMMVDGIDGKKVATNRAFYGMKQFFERIIDENPGKYINATEGGVHIQGTDVLPLQDVINQYCCTPRDIRSKLRHAVDHAPKASTNTIVKSFRSTLKTIEGLRKTIKQADSLSHNIARELDSLKKKKAGHRTLTSLPPALQQKLAKIDTLHNTLDNAKKIWPLLEELTLSGVQQSERLQHELNMLHGDPNRYLDWLAKNMERVLAINAVRSDVLTTFRGRLSFLLDFYAKEKKLLSDIKLDSENETAYLNLAKLYVSSEDLVRAEPILNKLLTISPDCAEAHFHLGIILAQWTQWKKADQHFIRALELNPGLAEQIDTFCKKSGDEYLSFAKGYKNIDKSSFKWLLFKGLRYDSNHLGIKTEIQAIAEIEFKQIIEASAKNVPEETETLILGWYKNFIDNPLIAECLSSASVADFYRIYGHLLMKQNNFHDAVGSLSIALKYAPNDPQLHIHLTDAHFALHSFDKGITHLQRAIAIDKNYGIYWEQIGTNFQKAGQFEDAIIAYEKCFEALPENIMVLKKMGDCYLELNEPESAQTAFQFLRDKSVLLSQSPTSQTNSGAVL